MGKALWKKGDLCEAWKNTEDVNHSKTIFLRTCDTKTFKICCLILIWIDIEGILRQHEKGSKSIGVKKSYYVLYTLNSRRLIRRRCDSV